MSRPTAIVTGGARGIGRATVELMLREGWRVAATARDAAAARDALGDAGDLAVIPLDLTDTARIPGAMDEAMEYLGHVDCLVDNAGHALMGAADDTDFDAVRAMFQANFFGAAEATAHVLPAMRARGRGTVVAVSSVGARFSNALLGYYHASKYAMTAWAESMRVENSRHGIRVHLIEPGMVNTEFPLATRVTGALARGEGDHVATLAQLRQGFAAWRARPDVTTAEDVAATILAAATDPSTPFRVVVGGDAREMADARAALDDDAFHRWLCGFLGIDPGPTLG
ncbi:MAG: SDR family NAD(P)-dependent oxidoreductase [Thermoleophilia bacterium]|nr:SDR family NAD(P)-dependent oxidoreductase [Thermoleophilia bacterium]